MTDLAPPPALPEPSRSWDLPLYLLGGFGLYLLTSVGYALLLQRLGIQTLSLPVVLGMLTLNLLCFGGMTLALGVGRQRLTLAELGVWPLRWEKSYLFWALGLAIAFMPVRLALAGAVAWLLQESPDNLQARADLLGAGTDTLGGAALMLLWAGVLVPISEELYFRGLLLRWFQPRLGLWPRVLVVAALFGVAHFDSPGLMLSAFLLGVFCTYAFERTRSIWFPIAIHAINNSLALLLYYVLLWLTDWLSTFN